MEGGEPRIFLLCHLDPTLLREILGEENFWGDFGGGYMMICNCQTS